MSLEKLLAVVDEKFGPSDPACYRFHLGRIAGQWRFTVVDSWHKWLERKLTDHFVGDTPARAVARFLAYVEANKIDVRSLTEAVQS